MFNSLRANANPTGKSRRGGRYARGRPRASGAMGAMGATFPQLEAPGLWASGAPELVPGKITALFTVERQASVLVFASVLCAVLLLAGPGSFLTVGRNIRDSVWHTEAENPEVEVVADRFLLTRQ